MYETEVENLMVLSCSQYYVLPLHLYYSTMYYLYGNCMVVELFHDQTPPSNCVHVVHSLSKKEKVS